MKSTNSSAIGFPNQSRFRSAGRQVVGGRDPTTIERSVVHTHALLPSWSAITVYEGAWLSSTTIPPAATAAAIRCSATSGATQTSMWNR